MSTFKVTLPLIFLKRELVFNRCKYEINQDFKILNNNIQPNIFDLEKQNKSYKYSA